MTMAKKKSGASLEFQRIKKQSLKKGFKITKKMVVGFICAILAVCVLIMAGFGVKYLTSSKDGSLRRNPFTDALIVDGDNWLLVCPDYEEGYFYKVGETLPIAGFELDRITYTTNKEKPIYQYTPIDPEAEDIMFYFVGTSEHPYDVMPVNGRQSVIDTLAPLDVSELITTTVNGVEVTYFYYVVGNIGEDGETIASYNSWVSAYVDCGRDDSCIIFHMTDQAATEEELASERLLTDYMDNIVKKITVELPE